MKEESIIKESRIHNTKRNITSGLIKQVLNLLLPFIIRTIVIYILGVEYQGLTGLFSAILQVMNLAELGFSSAVTFVLYEPVAKNDIKRICAIISYLKKVYKIISIVILSIGLAILPFLDKLISGSPPEGINIRLLFLIYLSSTVLSYGLFAYKSSLLTAMQRDDLVSKISIFSTTLVKVVQIIVLISFKNYYIFISVLPVGALINNLLIQYYSKKYFPMIYPVGKIDDNTMDILQKQVKALFIGKISDVARNSFDSIVLSTMLGLVVVTIYDNYYYIYSGIRGFFLAIQIAMQASVGNSIVQAPISKNYKDLGVFTLINMWLVGWCSVYMLVLYQPFMLLWMRNNSKMLLLPFNMILFCLYFYVICMNNTRDLYINGCGLYWKCRYWYVIEALGNLILNIALGYMFGVSGILIASIITIILFNFLSRTQIVFKHYFQMSSKQFYRKHIYYLIVTILAATFTWWISSFVPFKGVYEIVVKIFICTIVPNVIFLLAYNRTQYFDDAYELIKNVLRRLK